MFVSPRELEVTQGYRDHISFPQHGNSHQNTEVARELEVATKMGHPRSGVFCGISEIPLSSHRLPRSRCSLNSMSSPRVNSFSFIPSATVFASSRYELHSLQKPNQGGHSPVCHHPLLNATQRSY